MFAALCRPEVGMGLADFRAALPRLCRAVIARAVSVDTTNMDDLEYEVFSAALDEIPSLSLTSPELEALAFSMVDGDADGVVSAAEFSTAWSTAAALPRSWNTVLNTLVRAGAGAVPTLSFGRSVAVVAGVSPKAV